MYLCKCPKNKKIHKYMFVPVCMPKIHFMNCAYAQNRYDLGIDKKSFMYT